MPTVARLNITPVKSTALHHPATLRLEPYGAAGNRDLYFVDEDGRLQGGSKFGPYVQIESEHDAEAERLSLRFPDGTVVEGTADALGEPITTNFYGRSVPAHLVEGPWAHAVSAFVGRPIRLARVDRPGDGADIRPLTLVSLASVDELGRQGGASERVDPGRFRMILELDGCAPHEEDGWAGRRLAVGDAVIRVGDPVPRCVVTTQDPRTGLRDFPTLSVIKRYRGVIDGELIFGVYGDVDQPGLVRVGDEARLLDDA
ncbi:MAG: MOSC domain-containing protein [Actinomycetota bacterium]